MFQTVISALNEGFVQTLKLFVVTLVGSIPLGLIICFGSMSRWAPLGLPGRRLAARKAALDRQLEEDGEPIVDGGRVLSPVSARKKSGSLGFWSKVLLGFKPISLISRLIVWIIRGTPLLVQLFVIFYGLPSLGIVLSPFVSGVLGLSLCQGAYNSEIVRAAILSVPSGQWEAAKALGMTRAQTYMRIVIPQAARTAVPSLGNQFIGLTKDTSLAGMLTIPELLQTGQQITAVVYEPLALYLEVAFVYLLMNSALTVLQSKLEKRLSKHVQQRTN